MMVTSLLVAECGRRAVEPEIEELLVFNTREPRHTSHRLGDCDKCVNHPLSRPQQAGRETESRQGEQIVALPILESAQLTTTSCLGRLNSESQSGSQASKCFVARCLLLAMALMQVSALSSAAPEQPEPLRPAGRSLNPAPKTQAQPISKRAREIRNKIESNLTLGGVHSPFPQRVLTLRTIEAVTPTIKPGDEQPLCELLLDKDIRISGAATELLNNLYPDAVRIIEDRLASATTADERASLMSALDDVKRFRKYRVPAASAPASKK